MTSADFAARQSDLAYARVRNRRVVPLPPPVVIRGLQEAARKQATPPTRMQYARAAVLAGLAKAYGTSDGYALMVGNAELRMFPDYRPDEWDVRSDDDTFVPPEAPPTDPAPESF